MRRILTLAALLLGPLAALVASESSLELTLPPRWYAVPGVPVSLYFDNVVLTETPESYLYEVTCDIGKTEAKRWTVTPTDRDVGDHAMTVTVKDDAGKVLQQAKTVLAVASRSAGADRSLRIQIVGDSLTHATLYPNEIARLLCEPSTPQWTMLGTHKPAAAKYGVAHEGYGGWTWASFLTKFDPKPADVTAGPLASKSTSPFIYADETGKGVFDLQRYYRESCDNQPPDVVTFLLGINDCFGAKPDDPEALFKHIDVALDNADKLLFAFHKAAPHAALAVGLTAAPNARESGFEANYHGNYHRWGWKRIQHRLVQRMITRFGGREREGIHLVPVELNLDPIDGYPVNNGVHPNASGYAQIGASFYSWLKSWLAQNR
jgi:lysophospholipase L1-like esterase